MENIDIQQYYNAAMDSVSLINAGKQDSQTDEEWTDIVERNKEHLRIVVAKDFWTDEDLTPLQNAIGD